MRGIKRLLYHSEWPQANQTMEALKALKKKASRTSKPMADFGKRPAFSFAQAAIPGGGDGSGKRATRPPVKLAIPRKLAFC
ncbi:MAG: hypothetical protein SOZ63_07765 [Eggerthellaceae bacterium]|nr:hypothetical protein [Eggerthellaceae bacterium]